MKKLILSGTALLLSLGFSFAQGWVTTGAHDDFINTTVYKNGPNLEGVVWWADGVFAISRPGDGAMTVTATNAGGTDNGLTTGIASYPLIGVNFNDANDNGTGTAFTVDLTTGANIQLDIENTHASKLLYMSITLEDINNVQSKIEPNISDLAGTTWADAQRKALNGFTVPATERKTITIDLSSVPGSVGGLTGGAYTCSGPSDCPVTTYSIDITKIKGVLFTVNFGKDNIDLSEGDGDHTIETFIPAADCAAATFTGDIKFHDFKIGSTIVANGVNEAVIAGSLNVYPNPANDALTVSFDAATGADVTLSDITGFNVYSSSTNSGSNNITVNTSGLASGMYILNVATETGRVARKVTIE